MMSQYNNDKLTEKGINARLLNFCKAKMRKKNTQEDSLLHKTNATLGIFV